MYLYGIINNPYCDLIKLSIVWYNNNLEIFLRNITQIRCLLFLGGVMTFGLYLLGSPISMVKIDNNGLVTSVPIKSKLYQLYINLKG